LSREDRSLVIENASVVTPSGVLDGASIKVADGVIVEVGTSRLNGCSRRLDAGGLRILPGFIDLHSDAIEKEVEPRTSAFFPVNMAVFELDKKLAACGITTIYHSLSFDPLKDGVRESEVACGIIREVNRLAPVLGVRTRVHTRFEISNVAAVPFVEQLIEGGFVQLFSITDHTPGQGQYRDLAAYRRKSSHVRNLDDAAAAEVIDRKRREAVSLEADYVGRLVGRCRSLGIPVASHDDTEDKMDAVEAMGITITEFPIDMATAALAAGRGMHILFGAPNVVRGGSTGNNLNAREAISAGAGDILCSDYLPSAMVHAVFALERAGILPLYRAVNMASLNPARAVGIDGFTGSIEVGKSADLVLVDASGEVPKVLKTFVEGREVYSTELP
jgi:alpha-D-ribose 1-methylphosphonate 5-triphosphate diphosphatase